MLLMPVACACGTGGIMGPKSQAKAKKRARELEKEQTQRS